MRLYWESFDDWGRLYAQHYNKVRNICMPTLLTTRLINIYKHRLFNCSVWILRLSHL